MARLALEGEEQKDLAKDFQSILSYVKKIQASDTHAIPPTNHATGLHNRGRLDQVEPCDLVDALQRQAPTDTAFEIPSVRTLWTSKD